VKVCGVGGRRGHDDVGISWSTCVGLDNRIVCIALPVPPPDWEVPPPATACCGPIRIVEGGSAK